MTELEIPAEWVNAAAKAARDLPRGQVDTYADLARAALSAAYPLMERALKAEALREAADHQEKLAYGPRALKSKAVAMKRLIFAGWLRDRADALEEA